MAAAHKFGVHTGALATNRRELPVHAAAVVCGVQLSTVVPLQHAPYGVHADASYVSHHGVHCSVPPAKPSVKHECPRKSRPSHASSPLATLSDKPPLHMLINCSGGVGADAGGVCSRLQHSHPPPPHDRLDTTPRNRDTHVPAATHVLKSPLAVSVEHGDDVHEPHDRWQHVHVV